MKNNNKQQAGIIPFGLLFVVLVAGVVAAAGSHALVKQNPENVEAVKASVKSVIDSRKAEYVVNE